MWRLGATSCQKKNFWYVIEDIEAINIAEGSMCLRGQAYEQTSKKLMTVLEYLCINILQQVSNV
jgi:hypothetical protein